MLSSLSNLGWLCPPGSACPWVVRVTIAVDRACSNSSYISVVFLFSSRYFYCCPRVFLTGMSLHGVPVCLLLFRGGDGGGGASAAVARTRCPQEAKRALMSWDAGDFQPVLGEREMDIFETYQIQHRYRARGGGVRSRAESACHTAIGKRGLRRTYETVRPVKIDAFWKHRVARAPVFPRLIILSSSEEM